MTKFKPYTDVLAPNESGELLPASVLETNGAQTEVLWHDARGTRWVATKDLKPYVLKAGDVVFAPAKEENGDRYPTTIESIVNGEAKLVHTDGSKSKVPVGSLQMTLPVSAADMLAVSVERDRLAGKLEEIKAVMAEVPAELIKPKAKPDLRLVH